MREIFSKKFNNINEIAEFITKQMLSQLKYTKKNGIVMIIMQLNFSWESPKWEKTNSLIFLGEASTFLSL